MNISDTRITKLPDGSAFFTATILSEDEISKLPMNERPISSRLSSEMYCAVYEAIGAASMAWTPRPGDQVFDCETASQIAIDLCFKIANELEKQHNK